MISGLYTGALTHARHSPRENVFCYGVTSFLLDLDELSEITRRLRLLSRNRFNAFAFYDRDHLGEPGRSVKENVLDWLHERGVDLAGGRILLLTNLRVLGYVFNPVSFFHCYRPDGELACVIAEVSNTFGEGLPYLLGPEQRQETGEMHRRHAYATQKRLHVSPFMTLDLDYRFLFGDPLEPESHGSGQRPAERLQAQIDVLERQRRFFTATLAVRRQELTDRALVSAFFRYPLMTMRVTSLIHWQALKLYLKGVPFHHKPPFLEGHGSLRTGATKARLHGTEQPGTPAYLPPALAYRATMHRWVTRWSQKRQSPPTAKRHER